MLSKRETSFFNAAKAVSKLSNHRQKLGCIIVDKHRIISSGYNRCDKYHRIQALLDQKQFCTQACLGPIHAEVDALIPLINNKCDLSKATIYVYREHKDGNLALSRPCSRCMHLIRELNIRKIKYTTENGFAIEFLN